MKNFFKQIFSFILPVTVLIVIPLWIEDKIMIRNIPALIFGLILICAGLLTMAASIGLFIRKGKGTLAPWSPTRYLVIEGPYKYVRNPMIIGVLIVLTGEAIAILSLKIAIWALAFFIINNLYFILYEEPDLAKKFGKEYLDYKSNVKRWIPRSKPYQTARRAD